MWLSPWVKYLQCSILVEFCVVWWAEGGEVRSAQTYEGWERCRRPQTGWVVSAARPLDAAGQDRADSKCSKADGFSWHQIGTEWTYSNLSWKTKPIHGQPMGQRSNLRKFSYHEQKSWTVQGIGYLQRIRICRFLIHTDLQNWPKKVFVINLPKTLKKSLRCLYKICIVYMQMNAPGAF